MGALFRHENDVQGIGLYALYPVHRDPFISIEHTCQICD